MTIVAIPVRDQRTGGGNPIYMVESAANRDMLLVFA